MALYEDTGRVRLARIITFQDLPRTSWRNDGGRTGEIAAVPSASTGDALGWRVSVADVAISCEFSFFPGMDRVLVLCRGSNIVVAVDGSEHLLQPFEMVAFPGEADARARLLDGGTVDLNVMTRRREIAAQVAVCVVYGSTPMQPQQSATILLLALDGELRCRSAGTETALLSTFDTVVFDATSDLVELLDSGHFACVELTAFAGRRLAGARPIRSLDRRR